GERHRPLLVVVQREVERARGLDGALLEPLGQALEDLGDLGHGFSERVGTSARGHRLISTPSRGFNPRGNSPRDEFANKISHTWNTSRHRSSPGRRSTSSWGPPPLP